MRGLPFRQVLMLALVSVASLDAQEVDRAPSLSLPSGARALFSTTTATGLLRAHVVRNDATSVTFLLEGGGEQTVPISSLKRLEISVSRKRQTPAGALIGGTLGMVLSFTLPAGFQDHHVESWGFASRRDALITGAVMGVLVGSLVGTFVKTDDWTPVDLPGRGRQAPVVDGARPALFLSVSFRF